LDLIFELSIRARGSETPHTEAGHTVELDRIAYDQRRKIRLHSRGRPHTGHPVTRIFGIKTLLGDRAAG
jgi:hypothetical protein